ncbi:MAG: heavy metal translocating P-type ATPase [Halofilum sp. (in: g-proteobacteria)]|nr:heavy metal translocating P-type ATPase [Halofilum sp. (in: g-proteobacteria)]
MTQRGSCFHCGEPLPPGTVHTVRIDDEDRPVCCPGCAAVAQLIAESGLSGFYRYRSGPAPTPVPDAADEWTAYDRDAVQRTFVQDTGNGEREAVLLIEGLYCAACAWLIEHILTPIDGVQAIEVNPATGRALLRWDPERVALSTLFRRMSEIGYRPHPVDGEGTEPLAIRERRAALRRLGVAGLGMMQVMMYAVGLYAGAIHADMDPAIARLLRLVSLLVATPVVLYAGAPFFRGAWRDLRAGRPGMDVPVSLAIGAAFAASVWNTLIAGGEVYFDSVTMFVFFLSVARFFEMSARHRASRSTGALARMLPATALRITDGHEEHVALRELAVGDRVRVRAGEPVPADGRIQTGESRFDESLLTGEFQPVTRGVGADVIGGSMNTETPVDMEVTRIGQDTLVASIVRLLDRAQSQRPPIAQTADRVARWFVIGVLTAATATAAWWWTVAPGEAFGITLAVLVVTCPCALSLATPTALVAATSRLARGGLLITRARALENLARADHIVFDKTGTLTRGVLTITRTETMDRIEPDEARALAAALEAHSEHPIARAFSPWHDGRAAERIHLERGRGIEGAVAGHRLRLGRPDWVTGLAGGGDTSGTETIVSLGDADGLLARFHLADSPRAGTAEALSTIARIGLTFEVASGDAEGPVAALARDLGIEHWRARQTPSDKLARLESLRAAGHRVVMVGDGINDAPVLAAADVSVAMGGGSGLAGNNADMLLSAQRPADLAAGITHARRTLAVIRQNLAWAAGYNLIALPLAAAGFVAPWMAALGMSASSLIVVGNAMRLGRGDTAPAAEGPVPPKATVETA